MSVSEFIFLKTEKTPASAAQSIANALDMEVFQEDDETFVRSSGVENISGDIGGEVYSNIYSNINDPDNFSIFDYHSIVWDIWRPGSDEETQLAAARLIFLGVTRKLGWPAILVHDIELLIADWNPQRGLRDFPAGTTPYDTDITA